MFTDPAETLRIQHGRHLPIHFNPQTVQATPPLSGLRYVSHTSSVEGAAAQLCHFQSCYRSAASQEPRPSSNTCDGNIELLFHDFPALKIYNRKISIELVSGHRSLVFGLCEIFCGYMKFFGCSTSSGHWGKNDLIASSQVWYPVFKHASSSHLESGGGA